MPQPHSPCPSPPRLTPSPPTIDPSLLMRTDSKGKGKKKETCLHPNCPPRGLPYTHPLQKQAGSETTDKLRRAILLNAALMTE
jgi:hypothetical protein